MSKKYGKKIFRKRKKTSRRADIRGIIVLLQQNYLFVMELPKDPMMLFSVINMKLRDCYSSLDELCEDMNVDREDIVSRLKNVGFEYSAEYNKFW
ncbi:hypothetical protein IX324_001045 [Bacteroides pyogenes]|nr:hypothetical protein [Bacteroides pyogenes]GAE17340.1 hypothetical protein JCM6294_72 [Bacteroides pyogenes DSM 20611 = JCM 6294]